MNRRILAGALCAMLLLATSCGQDTPPASSGGITMDSTSTGSKMTTAVSSIDESTPSSDSSAEETGTDRTRNQAGGKTSGTRKTNGGQPTKTVTTATIKSTVNPTPVAVEKTLKPLTASDESQFWGNPDRGFRTHVASVNVATIAQQEDMKTYCRNLITKVLGQSEEYPGDDTMVMQNYFYLYDYRDNGGKIDARGLEALRTFLQVQKEMGITCQPRFCYATTMPDPEHEAPQAIILSHIDQLAPVIREMKDVIHSFPICFIGAWGEWHSTDTYPLDKKTICTAVMEKLVVPNGLYGIIRLPEYKNLVKDEPWYDRLGIENDAVFGKVPYGYGNADGGTGGLEDGNDQWLQLTQEAAYTPQDGEMYLNSWFTANDAWVDAKRCVLQFSEHRFTTFSISHGYLETKRADSSQIGKWKQVAVTEDWLKENNVLYDTDWFKDKNGKTVSRNVFEFVRDHLGYRVVGRDLKVTGNSKPSATIQVDMTIENRGFSAAFRLESGFAILDANNQVVSTVKCGNPETWYNRNPDNYEDGKQLSHKLSTTIQLPGKAGHYKLAFYLKNSIDRYARVSIDTSVVNGYHILHEFDIA